MTWDILKYDMQTNKLSSIEGEALKLPQHGEGGQQEVAVGQAASRGITQQGRWRVLFFWLILLSLTLILRLVEADTRGIWQDEGLTLYQVRLPFGEILANRIPVAHFITQNTVPPLYFLLLGAWGRALGYGLWGLRLFSIFCSLLVSVLIYRVGSWIDGPRSGRVAALLTAISPLYLWYAQELRMYTFILVPATLSFGLLWRWYKAETGRASIPAYSEREHKESRKVPWRWAVAYALTAGAMAWTHYLGFLLIGAQLLWLIVFLGARRMMRPAHLGKFPKVLLIMGGGFLLIALPLIPFGIRRLLSGAERDFYFQSLDFIVNNMLHSLAFGVPIFMVYYEQIDFLFPLAWLLLALGVWQAWRRGGWSLLGLLVGGLALPILALYIISYIKPLYQNARHLIFISPAFYLLWALGLVRLAEIRRWLPLLLIPLLAYSWLLAINHYFNPTRSLKNDVRPLFEDLAQRYVPGEVVALNDPVLQHAFEYFAPGVPWIDLPPYAEQDPQVRRQAYQTLAEKYDRIWFVHGPPDTSFDTHTWQEVYEWLAEHYGRLTAREYRGQTAIAATLFDTQGPIIQKSEYPAFEPADVLFDDGIRFVGLYKPLPQRAPAGQRFVIDTLFQVDAQPTQDIKFVIRLVDGNGKVWNEQPSRPFDGWHPTNRWLPNQFVRVPLFIRPRISLPPANYNVDLYLRSIEGQLLYPKYSGQPHRLGSLTVTRPKTSSGPQKDPPRKVDGPLIDEALRVQAESLPERLPPAPILPLTLLLEVTTDGRLPDHFDINLQNAKGETAVTLPLPVSDGLPTHGDGSPQFLPDEWQPGDIFTLRYQIQLPPTLSGDYQVDLAAKQQETAQYVRRWWGLYEEKTLSLGQIFIEPRTPRTDAPPFEHEVTGQPTWNGNIHLLGYSAQPEPATNKEPFRFVLIWQAMAPTDRPYKVFLHLIDENGTFITGADAFFDVPTLAWMKDEIIISEHTFSEYVAPGHYTLLVGLYHEASQERLAVDAPNFALPMGSIKVEE